MTNYVNVGGYVGGYVGGCVGGYVGDDEAVGGKM